MNFDREIKHAVETARDALSQAEALEEKYKQAKNFTAIFLDECKERDIAKVAIGRKSKSVPATQSWPFGFSGQVFQFVPEAAPKDKDGDSKATRIWRVVDEMGIGGGCGNSNQHALSDEGNNKLIDGVYEFKHGKWIKIIDQS